MGISTLFLFKTKVKARRGIIYVGKNKCTSCIQDKYMPKFFTSLQFTDNEGCEVNFSGHLLPK